MSSVYEKQFLKNVSTQNWSQFSTFPCGFYNKAGVCLMLHSQWIQCTFKRPLPRKLRCKRTYKCAFRPKKIYIMRSHVATHVFQSFFRLYVHNIRPLNARWKLYQFNFDQSETRVPAGRWQQFQNTELYPCSKTITSWKYALHGNMFKKFNKKAGTKLIMEEILIIVVCAWAEFHETFPQYPNL